MIISISGRIGSGKDSVADMLVKKYGFVHESFAGTLKDVVSVMFGWNREMLEGKTKESREQREIIDEWWAKRLNIPELSPRWVLQHLSTDVIRKYFHDEIWIASIEHKLSKINQSESNIVISDARFINELKLLDNAGAKMVCIDRKPVPVWWSIAEVAYDDENAMSIMLESDIHQSEWDWAGYDFDVRINNNGSFLDLETQVDSLIRV